MRQNVTPNPEVRMFEAYMSFAGGHNSEIANDRLRDDEFTIMENVDLSGRDSAKRRTGRSMFLNLPNKCQGHFLYYNVGMPKPKHIFAVSGYLYAEVGGQPRNITIGESGTNVYHTNTLTINSISANGTFTVNLNGVKTTINVFSTDTPTVLADRIRFYNYPGWTVSGTGGVVVFTAKTYGIKSVSYTSQKTSDPLQLSVSIGFATTVVGQSLVFQAKDMIEAVQYGTVLYIATGTKLVELYFKDHSLWEAAKSYAVGDVVLAPNGYFYNCTKAGTSNTTPPTHTTPDPMPVGSVDWQYTSDEIMYEAKVVTPYTPTVQEVIYIGTNGLAPNPNSYVQDTVTSSLTLSGISPYYRSGAVNMDLPMTAYIGKPGSIANVDYKWEYKITGSNTLATGTTEAAELIIVTSPTSSGNITVTLDGVPFTFAVTTGQAQNVIGANIRAGNFPGWTVGGGGNAITFTANTVGSKADLTFSAGTTGTSASTTTTRQGTPAGVTTWTLGRDWTSGASGGKNFNLKIPAVGSYDVQVTIRDSANTNTTATGSITGYRVEATLNKENNTQDVSGIQTCKSIRLHWDRILLYGDEKNPFLMYISDLKNPRYFPTTNVASFDTGKLEPITSVTRFQDYLVVMTTTTIQTLVGKDPTSYGRYLIHDSIGCIAKRSAAVVGNQVIFLSYNGVTSLRPNPYRIEVMNVKRTDIQIHGEISARTIKGSLDTNACAMFHDNQYWLCFPASKTIYRYYHETGIWVRDKSSKLNITQFLTYGGNVYNITDGTEVYIHDESVWKDSTDIYTMEVESKTYDLGYSFNFKKLRKLFLLARHFDTATNLYVKIDADSSTVLTPEDGQVVIAPDGSDTVWISTTSSNMHFMSYYAGTVVGQWILGLNPLGDIQLSVQKASIQGKCRRVKINIKHQENLPCEIFGMGFEFKLKKV